MMELILFALSLVWPVFMIYGAYKLLSTLKLVQGLLKDRERAAYDAYIDSEVERRKVLLREMKRIGYDREDTMPEDLDKLRALFKGEFPDLYQDNE